LSVDGGPITASGPLTFRIGLDNTTPDLTPGDPIQGLFASTSAVLLTAPTLGFANDAIVLPSPLFVRTINPPKELGGVSVGPSGGPSGQPVFGWNGGPPPPAFMFDVNNLTTLPLPTVLAVSGTFFCGGPMTLASGHSLSAPIPDFPPGCGSSSPGTFSATAAAVPDATSLLLLSAGLTGLAGTAIWRGHHRK
jgi:hypothetical protein